MNDFIWYQEDVYDKEFCDSLIVYYEKMVECGFGVPRKVENLAKTKKDDTTVFVTEVNAIDLSSTRLLANKLNEIFWMMCYRPYAEQFDVLTDFASHSVYTQRIQKTNIGGGYHLWHCENSNKPTNGRILAFTIYLNDVEEGGETEFLYYPKRIKPKTGSVLIFPSGFTHTHRGNPPISNEKYIVTGWVEF
jgi:hypothetical protein